MVKTFTRSDGCALQVIEGFRQRVLSYRTPVTPQATWSDADYAAAAERKRKRLKRLVGSFQAWGKDLKGAEVLDVGCGDGANCLLLAMEEPIKRAVGIDLDLPSRATHDKGERTRRLVHEITGGRTDLPVEFLVMDGTQMAFADGSFDLVMSRSAMEHIHPLPRAVPEMLRVARSGAVIYLGIDPFFWLRGCHKRGIVDIPWAHARLSLDDFQRFVEITEGRDASEKRRTRLETLNRLTVAEWRKLIDSAGCELLDWKQKHSEIGERVLEEYPDILQTLLPGLSDNDLLTERIEVWLRKR